MEAPKTRRVAVLAIHGIGQQSRGDCARELARCIRRVVARDPAVPWFELRSGSDSELQPGNGAIAEVRWCERNGTLMHMDFYELWWGPLACTPIGWMDLARLCWGVAVPAQEWHWAGWPCARKWVLDASILAACVGGILASAAHLGQHVAAGLGAYATLPCIVAATAWVVCTMAAGAWAAVAAARLLGRRHARGRPSVQITGWAAAFALAGLVVFSRLDAFAASAAPVAIVILFAGAWALKWFAVHYLGDVVRYAGAGPYTRHARVRHRVVQQGTRAVRQLVVRRGERPARLPYNEVVLCAHSLGSVVAADVLAGCSAFPWWRSRARLRVRLITLGAPLAKFGFFDLQSALGASGRQVQQLSGMATRGELQWTNLWYACDPVADRLDGTGVVVQDVRIGCGWPLWCHLDYWRGQAVGELLRK